MNPIAFTIGGLEVRWYGILIAAAMIIAMVITYRRSPNHDISFDKLLDVLIVSILCGIIGARLYYVIFQWDWYRGDLLRILNIREGGLAIHGGLLAGILSGWIMCRVKKIPFLNALDLILPVVALAQSIGRWGNFFNQEAYGSPTTLPWGIMINGVKVHPTFLYESLWCLLVFIILSVLDRNRNFTGQIACLYGILYSVERFFVEDLRTDSLMISSLKMAQLISLLAFSLCLALYLWLARKNAKHTE